MKALFKLIKIALFVGFLYNAGLYDALLVSDELDYSYEQAKTTALNKYREDIKSNIDNGSVQTNGQMPYQDYLTRELRNVDLKSLDNNELVTVVKFFIGQYLPNLPLALILFLLWFYTDKKKFKSPVSFIISLIIYPIVIAIIMFEWLRNFEKNVVIEAELRRTKDKFFTLLSENEIAFIKKAIKENRSRKDFQNQLKSRGLKVQHSFAIVMVATIVLMVIPKTLIASEVIELSSGLPSITISITQSSSINDDTGQSFIDIEIIQPIQIVYFKLLGWIDNIIYFKLPVCFVDIDHIPLCVQVSFNQLNCTIKKQRGKNEKE